MAVLIRSLEPALSVAKGHVGRLSLTLRGKWVTGDGLELNQSDWMNLSTQERADLVTLVNKGFVNVTVDGTALTAAQIEACALAYDADHDLHWIDVPGSVKAGLDELASRVDALDGLGS